MRVAELIRAELERAQTAIPGPWTICVSVDVHQQLARELEVPYLDSLHGEHLRVMRADDDELDLVILMPAIPIHTFTAEEALAAARVQSATSRVRRMWIPPAHLAEQQQEVFQRLRGDGVEPMQAQKLAALLT